MNSNVKNLWNEYEKGVRYNTGIDLYEQTRHNENFYAGKQWEGLRAGNLDKPVLNILRRVVSYFIATLVSDDIGVGLTAFDPRDSKAEKVLSDEIGRVIERSDFKALSREVIRAAAIAGDGAIYFHFDADAETGQKARGSIMAERIEGCNVHFGNPYSDQLQNQPYILISMRKTVESVREEAKKNGMSEEETRNILSDTDRESGIESGESDGLCTVVLKFEKYQDEKGHRRIRAVKFTAGAVIKPQWETGLSLYPISFMQWDKIRGSFHGMSPITSLIPNQIFINKLFAMAMQSVKLMAFPKIFYDRTRIGDWSNKLDDAIGVVGDPQTQIYTGFRAPDMSGQVMQMIDRTIEYTKETMGASDAALGNVRPDNTSAIIAVQKAAAAPLELQRLAYFHFVEDSVRIMLDFISVCYGKRLVPSDKGAAPVPFDFGAVDYPGLRLQVDVGTSAYWSELTQMQTLDNLFTKGILTDAVAYLERVPVGYIKGKTEIIDKLREQLELQEKAAENAAMQDAMKEVMGNSGGQGAPAGGAPTGGIDPAMLASLPPMR